MLGDSGQFGRFAMEAKKEAAPDNVNPTVRALATHIYVDLAVRATTVSESAVKMTASAENLAKLSYQLSEAFFAAEEAFILAKAPKSTFKMDQANIDDWTKK